jgi:hypothetical protein
MRLPLPRAGLWSLFLLAGTAITLSASSGGCGRTACFVYTLAEYDRAGGTCPAQKDALADFTDPSCAGPVISVDGAGEFSLLSTDPTGQNGLCCYSVTQEDVTPTFAGGCTGPGHGGAGGAGGTGGVAGTSVVEVGVGAGGTSGGCVTCNQVLMGASMNQICDMIAMAAWSTLQSCLCGDAGLCAAVCSLNVCQMQPITSECASCVLSTNGGCGPQLMACEGN